MRKLLAEQERKIVAGVTVGRGVKLPCSMLAVVVQHSVQNADSLPAAESSARRHRFFVLVRSRVCYFSCEVGEGSLNIVLQ